MTKKFRDLIKAPCSKVICVGCGLIINKEELEHRCWYKVCKDKEIYCCPNCDVTIIEK